ncbi:MAG TPA: ATP-binding cassette domain-containing protein [Thermoleophilaceae bacterium]|nr:ATP-binding cassette domain-containing protein [Thermoleophilaceae bacterium]
MSAWPALLARIRPHRRTLAVSMVLALLGAAGGLAQPLAAREVIEALADDESLLTPLLVLGALVLFSAVLMLVVFDRVSFGYRPDLPEVLHEVSFEVPARGVTGIVGPSGAGKTTLFALLERFYEPDAGTIRFQGRDLAAWPRAVLRAQIGYVEQEAPVLAGTLRDNLLYAAPEAGEDALEAVLREARLDELVARLPHGLDTQISARGTSLSGGERQRIAIARALLRRPALLLLDEAASQLDAVNEMALRDTVARAGETRAVLAIAHRLSTVVAARRIVVLEAGRVRATGSHAELVQSDALYAELAATQLTAA